ncbi:MAG: dihydrolipoyl dehydrogenase [bacterium]
MHDVIVIGCGPGGYAAAIRAAQLGGKVAVVEAAETGGTCVNRGCIPAKVWHQAASILQTLGKAEAFGIQTTGRTVELKTIAERKSGVSAEIRMGMEGLLANNGIEVTRGKAALRSAREIAVDGAVREAGKIILATGGALLMPDVPGLKDALLTTDQVFDMSEVPASVLVWGAGFVEVEMANILNAFGAKVTVATDAARILPREDHDTSQRVGQVLREQGVEIAARVGLEAVEKSPSGFVCRLGGPKERVVEAARVLVASRRPHTAGLGLEGLGMAFQPDGGIRVDERLETSVKGVYAVGDCTGGWMLSHAASAMGIVAAENAMGQDSRFPFHLIPRASWTSPEVGAVGLSEEEAEKQGKEIEVGLFPYAINGLAMCRNQVEGAVKVIADAKYGEILGVHIVGSQATELVGEAVLAMQLECTAREFARSIRVHPTFSEAVVDAARDAEKWALYLPKR